MIYENLLSNTIRNALVSKMNFSLGFSLISALIKAKRPLQLKIDSEGELDYTPIERAQELKVKWHVFREHAATLDVPLSNLEEIAEKYILSNLKPASLPSDSVAALRARVSGMSVTSMKQQQEDAARKEQAKLTYAVQKVVAEVSDIGSYVNEWYSSVGVEDHTEGQKYIELDDIFTDKWVVDKYEDCLKSQIAYWNKYNNWDDAELVLIEGDLKLIRK